MSCSPKSRGMRQGSPLGLQAQSPSIEASSIAARRPAPEWVRRRPWKEALRCRHPRSLQDHVEIGPDPPDVLAKILALAHRDQVGAFGTKYNVVDGLDAGRPLRQHDDAIGKRYRLFDVVGDEKERAFALPHQCCRIVLDQ